MTTLALLLLVAAIGHALSKWTGISAIPILIGLGMTLSFAGVVEHPGLEATARMQDDPLFLVMELGLTFLLFASGLEMNPHQFRRQRRAVLLVGLAQFLAMGGLGFAGARLLGFDDLESVYLGVAVSASSTLVVLRQLRVTQQSFEPSGRMVIGVLLLQDALTIAMLILLARSGEGAGHALAGFAWAALMAGAAWLLQRRGALWIIERCRQDEESMLLSVLTILFLFLGVADLVGLPLVVGAFMAGYSLSSFPVNGLVGGLLLSLTDFFRAVFFVALGALVTIPALDAVIAAGLLAVLVIVVTPPLVAAVAEWAGFTARPAIESGLLLAQTSEYSLILGLTGVTMGHLSVDTFSAIALMAVATMTLTPFFASESVARALLPLHPLRRRRRRDGESQDQWEGHVLVLGLGSAGMWVLRPLKAAGYPVLVVDDDPAVIHELDRKGIPCLRGDGSDEQVLARAGAQKARFIIASMRRVSDAEKVLSCVSGVPVVVRVFEDHEAEAIRNLGGIAILNSEAAVEQFMKWFEAGENSSQAGDQPVSRPSGGFTP